MITLSYNPHREALRLSEQAARQRQLQTHLDESAMREAQKPEALVDVLEPDRPSPPSMNLS